MAPRRYARPLAGAKVSSGSARSTATPRRAPPASLRKRVFELVPRIPRARSAPREEVHVRPLDARQGIERCEHRRGRKRCAFDLPRSRGGSREKRARGPTQSSSNHLDASHAPVVLAGTLRGSHAQGLSSLVRAPPASGTASWASLESLGGDRPTRTLTASFSSRIASVVVPALDASRGGGTALTVSARECRVPNETVGRTPREDYGEAGIGAPPARMEGLGGRVFVG